MDDSNLWSSKRWSFHSVTDITGMEVCPPDDSRFKIQENFIYPEGNCCATVVKQSEK